METAERHLYPFTKHNPYLPWLEQLRISLLGESGLESLKRFKALEYADRVANNLSVSKGKHIDLSGVSPALTPNVWYESVVGTNFATPIPKASWIDVVHTYNVQNQLSQLPPTPTMNPGLLDVGEWKSHVKEGFTENTDNWLKDWKTGDRGKWIETVKGGKVASSSVSTEIPSTSNKFAALEVD